MAEGIKSREEIQEEYKWDLSKIYAHEEEIERDIQRAEKLTQEVAQFKDGLKDEAKILECLKKADELGRTVDKLYTYAHMLLDEDRNVGASQSLNDRIKALAVQSSSVTSFIEPELTKLDPKLLKKMMEDDEFASYQMYFREIERGREYVLTEEEERIIASFGEVAGAPSEIFSMLTNADMDFGSIPDEEGREAGLSEGRIQVFLQSQNRDVRKRAYNRLYEVYTSYKNTLARTLANSVKVNSLVARLRNFGSSMEISLFPDNVSTQVYDNLIAAVNGKLQYLHDYAALKKEVLGLDELRIYDLAVPLVEEYDKQIPYGEAVEIIKKGLSKLGGQYVKDLETGLTSGWVDAFENKGKRSGAYSSGSYDTMPYILMNYNDRLQDVFTLAHELGHSMHSYYSNREQDYRNAQYSIFVAEVASIFNETLLLEHLLKNAENREEELYLLSHNLEGYRTVMYRQTMFAEFEKFVHQKVDSGEPLTPEILSEEYYGLNEKYYGPEITLDDEISMEWARIPHFYYNFYVYKYSIGFAAAKALSQPIIEGREDRLQAYLSFLESGGSQYPLELLKKAGVDMSVPGPVEDCLGLFGESIERFREIKGKPEG
ncbi:MAG: oligoendopeptidase F [Clostridia bacterium]|nr:oligoendopeptidase F [Clostridia bacterium]